VNEPNARAVIMDAIAHASRRATQTGEAQRVYRQNKAVCVRPVSAPYEGEEILIVYPAVTP
jgi:hypothetical protein